MVIDSNFKEDSFQALAVMCNKGILHRMYKNLKNKSSTKNNLIKKWDIELNKETKKILLSMCPDSYHPSL